jgi:hypothetical protein
MTNWAGMLLRPHETLLVAGGDMRTADGPRQRTLRYLGELNGSAQARWLTSIKVFNAQVEQLKLFASRVEQPADA